MKDKVSRISGKCSRCKKDTTFPNHVNSKSVLCKDCFLDKNMKFKLKWDKIKNFNELPDLWFFDPSLTEILMELHPTKNTKLESSLKELVIIKLVTLVEIRFRELMRYWIEYFSPRLEILFPNDPNVESILQDIKKYDSDGGFIKEDLAVANFNWQNLEVINKYFSRLLGLNFFQAVKDLDILLGGTGNIEYNWDKLENLFELRNQIIHNAKKIELSFKDLFWLTTIVIIFINGSQKLIDNYVIIDTYEEGSDDITESLGVSYDHMKEIIDKNRI